MATANFYTNNASAVYAIRTHWDDEGERFNLDFWDILEIVHYRAMNLNDSCQFQEANESERRRGNWGGTICLTYDAPALDLPGGLRIESEGRIVIRSGYYDGANLDWDFSARLSNWYDHDTNDYCSPDDIPEALMEDFAEAIEWNAGLIKIHGKRILHKIETYLNDLTERLDRACRELCDDRLVCVARFGNGEAVYM